MVVLTVSKPVKSRNSDCTTFREGVIVFSTLNHRISVYVTSKGEILRIRKVAKLSSFVRLWITKRTTLDGCILMMDELTAPVLAPPHIFGKFVVRHIPTGILEESKSSSGDFLVW